MLKQAPCNRPITVPAHNCVDHLGGRQSRPILMLSSITAKLPPYTRCRAAFAPCTELLSCVIPSNVRNERLAGINHRASWRAALPLTCVVMCEGLYQIRHYNYRFASLPAPSAFSKANINASPTLLHTNRYGPQPYKVKHTESSARFLSVNTPW